MNFEHKKIMILSGYTAQTFYLRIHGLGDQSLPGLLIEPSENGGGWCGLHAATRIIKRITSAPNAMPRMAAFEIEAVCMIASKIRMMCLQTTSSNLILIKYYAS